MYLENCSIGGKAEVKKLGEGVCVCASDTESSK